MVTVFMVNFTKYIFRYFVHLWSRIGGIKWTERKRILPKIFQTIFNSTQIRIMKPSRMLIEFEFWRTYLELFVCRLKRKVLVVRVENSIPRLSQTFGYGFVKFCKIFIFCPQIFPPQILQSISILVPVLAAEWWRLRRWKIKG